MPMAVATKVPTLRQRRMKQAAVMPRPAPRPIATVPSMGGGPVTMEGLRGAPSLAQQRMAARYGATGLAGPTYAVQPTGLYGGREPGPARGIMWNEATMRALSRGATARGLRLRAYLKKRDEAGRKRRAALFERYYADWYQRGKAAWDAGDRRRAAYYARRIASLRWWYRHGQKVAGPTAIRGPISFGHGSWPGSAG